MHFPFDPHSSSSIDSIDLEGGLSFRDKKTDPVTLLISNRTRINPCHCFFKSVVLIYCFCLSYLFSAFFGNIV